MANTSFTNMLLVLCYLLLRCVKIYFSQQYGLPKPTSLVPMQFWWQGQASEMLTDGAVEESKPAMRCFHLSAKKKGIKTFFNYMENIRALMVEFALIYAISLKIYCFLQAFLWVCSCGKGLCNTYSVSVKFKQSLHQETQGSQELLL